MTEPSRHPDVAHLPPLPSSVAAGRVPQWDLSNLIRRTCPVCGDDAPGFQAVRPDKLAVARCDCGMLYLPEIPAPDDLEAFYRRYDEYKNLAPTKRSWWPTQRLGWANPHVMILEHSGGLRGRRVCEVGCSYGSFLELARRRGAEVRGVELDVDALEHLRGRGIEASRRIDPSQPCDVLCAFQLIEHLADPGAWLDEVAAALVPDGRVLLAMPNGGEFARLGPSWVGLRLDLEHLNYFSAAPLAQLLAGRGLYVENAWESLQPWLTRVGEASSPSLLRTAGRYLLGKLSNQPFYIEGRFVLTVLARKVRRR